MICTLTSLSACDQPTESLGNEHKQVSVEKGGLVFIVHPYDNPSRLVKRFRPLCNHLSNILGTTVRLEIARSYVDQVHRITKGQADLAYMGPTPFLRAQTAYLPPSAPKLQTLAAEVVGGEATYHSVIVTRADSTIDALSKLSGKLMAFGAPHSYSSHYVPRIMLLKSGVDLSRLKDYAYLGRHERVALAVLHGDFDAGGLRQGVAAQYLDREPGLRIIAKSPALPPHLIVARPGLDEDTSRHVREALFAYNQRPNDGAPNIQFRPPDPKGNVQVRKVVNIIEQQAAPTDWPW